MGRRVVASLTGMGGYAERARAPTRQLIEIPEQLAVREAVAVLADGRTALALVSRAQLREGDTVLVEAAAGGVGTLLVQLARQAGARVVALASGERKLTVARDLGADVTVDYSESDWPRRVRDAVAHVAAFDLLGADGRFCPFGMASGRFAPVTPELAQARQITVLRGTALSAEELTALTRAALTEAAAGRIRPVIGQELDLAQAAAAHAAIEARATIGKTLLAVPR